VKRSKITHRLFLKPEGTNCLINKTPESNPKQYASLSKQPSASSKLLGLRRLTYVQV
jgi:hypothetical protein